VNEWLLEQVDRAHRRREAIVRIAGREENSDLAPPLAEATGYREGGVTAAPAAGTEEEWNKRHACRLTRDSPPAERVGPEFVHDRRGARVPARVLRRPPLGSAPTSERLSALTSRRSDRGLRSARPARPRQRGALRGSFRWRASVQIVLPFGAAKRRRPGADRPLSQGRNAHVWLTSSRAQR
jgi:hypothetical protein